MDKYPHPGGSAPPHYTLGLDKVEIDAVLSACELVGRVLKGVTPEANARSVARLLTEATRDEHHDEPLTRSILVEVARALQCRNIGVGVDICPEPDSALAGTGRTIRADVP